MMSNATIEPKYRMERCALCAKKLGLVAQTTGKCKCGKTFCTKHKACEDHACTFDHHAAAQEKLAKALPVVAPTKVEAF